MMAFASLYIGDSQTMAAEAGVLGVPFVRFNDFVGRIGYLRELEDIYHLGFGIHATPLPNSNPQLVPQLNNSTSNNALREQPSGPEAMYEIVERLVAMDATERRALYQQRREKMLSEKIDCAKFLTWFIESYPQSAQQVSEVNASSESEFWKQFK